jgi:hypothetical protein
MSSCLVLNNGNQIIMSADTALSSFDGNTFRRIGNDQQKVFKINDSLIFCSGEVSIVKDTISFIESLDCIDVEKISSYLKSKNIQPLENIFSIEMLIAKPETVDLKLYQLSEYNNFDVVILETPPDNQLAIYCAGIKTEECASISERELSLSRDVKNAILKIYKQLSCDQIGGYLDVWLLSKNGISKIFRDKIDDILEGDKSLSSIYHSLVADVLVGRLLAGNNLIIENENNSFTVDGAGATLHNASFTVENVNTKIVIDPSEDVGTYPFRIQRNESSVWVDKFWVDELGNVEFSGTLTGATGSFSGSVTAGEGYIGTLVIDEFGLKTADGINYLRGNGDLHWGLLTISGSTATFSGNIYAANLRDNVELPVFTAAGVMSGDRIYAGRIIGPGMYIDLDDVGYPIIDGEIGVVITSNAGTGDGKLVVLASGTTIIEGSDIGISSLNDIQLNSANNLALLAGNDIQISATDIIQITATNGITLNSDVFLSSGKNLNLNNGDMHLEYSGNDQLVLSSSGIQFLQAAGITMAYGSIVLGTSYVVIDTNGITAAGARTISAGGFIAGGNTGQTTNVTISGTTLHFTGGILTSVT